MNKDTVAGKWNDIVGEAKKVWGKLTDDDYTAAKGDLDSLGGRLQSVYGYSKERAADEVNSLKKKLSSVFADNAEKANNYVHDKTKNMDNRN